MLLTDALEQYLAANTRITSEQTGRRYRTALNALHRHLERAPDTGDLNADTYAKWIAARRRQVSANTVRGEAEKVRVIWRWLAKRGETEWPEVTLPQRQTKAPATFTDDEMRRLWRTAQRCKWLVGHVPGDVYWPALLSVLYETAERINAVHQVEWADIDLTTLRITYRAETRKGKSADNVAMITRGTRGQIKALRKYNPVLRPFAPLKLATIRVHFDRLLVEAKIDHQRRKKFHGLRSRAASDLQAAGGNASLLLCHADPAVTQRHYLDPKIVQRKSPVYLLRRWRRWLPWGR